MMKHLQCRLSPTPKNKGFLIKYIDPNTALVFEARYMATVGRKTCLLFRVCVLFGMTDLCLSKLLNRFRQMFLRPQNRWIQTAGVH